MLALHHFRFRNSSDALKRYKMNRNRFKNVICQKKGNFLKQKKEELIRSRSNPLKFWKLIKQARASKRSYDKIKDSQWLEYFKGLLFDINREDTCTTNFECIESEVELFQSSITDEEVRKSILTLKPGKAGGPDGIISEMLKSTLVEICPVLVVLYNKIFDQNNGRGA